MIPSAFNRSSLLIFLIAIITADCMLPVHSPALIGMKEGDRPNEIVLNDLDGKTVKLSQHLGKKPVIIVFWELVMDDSYLNYSLDALKFLNSFYEKHHDKKGLEVFSVYTPVEDKEIPDAEILEVRNLIASNKIQFPVLVDEGFKTFRNYGIIALPSIIMVGKTGKIEFIYPSFPMSAQEVVSKQAKALIGLAPAEQKEAQVKKKEGEDSQARRLYRYSLQMYKKGLSEQALSALNKSLSLDPDYSWARNLKGIILFKRGNSQDSMEEFKRAIALDNNIAAHINLAIMLSEQDQYKESEGIIKSASYDRIDFKVRAHYLLGLSYRNMNKHDLAIRELELAENLFDVWASENEDSHFYTYSYRIPILRDLSELYSRSGDNKRAMERLQKAVNITLDHESSSGTDQRDPRKGYMVFE